MNITANVPYKNKPTTTLSTNKSKPKPSEIISTKKKTKIDKDAKVESFENKELHLKAPKHKKASKIRWKYWMHGEWCWSCHGNNGYY